MMPFFKERVLFAWHGTRRSTLDDYRTGKFNFPEEIGDSVYYQKRGGASDAEYIPTAPDTDDGRQAEDHILIESNAFEIQQSILPYNIQLGQTRTHLRLSMKRPPVYILNDRQAGDPCEIWVFKRHIGPFLTTTQVTLVNNLVTRVIEVIKKDFKDQTLLFPRILRYMKLNLALPVTSNLFFLKLTNSMGQQLLVEEDVEVRLIFSNL